MGNSTSTIRAFGWLVVALLGHPVSLARADDATNDEAQWLLAVVSAREEALRDGISCRFVVTFESPEGTAAYPPQGAWFALSPDRGAIAFDNPAGGNPVIVVVFDRRSGVSYYMQRTQDLWHGVASVAERKELTASPLALFGFVHDVPMSDLIRLGRPVERNACVYCAGRNPCLHYTASMSALKWPGATLELLVELSDDPCPHPALVLTYTPQVLSRATPPLADCSLTESVPATVYRIREVSAHPRVAWIPVEGTIHRIGSGSTTRIRIEPETVSIPMERRFNSYLDYSGFGTCEVRNLLTGEREIIGNTGRLTEHDIMRSLSVLPAVPPPPVRSGVGALIFLAVGLALAGLGTFTTVRRRRRRVTAPAALGLAFLLLADSTATADTDTAAGGCGPSAMFCAIRRLRPESSVSLADVNGLVRVDASGRCSMKGITDGLTAAGFAVRPVQLDLDRLPAGRVGILLLSSTSGCPTPHFAYVEFSSEREALLVDPPYAPRRVGPAVLANYTEGFAVIFDPPSDTTRDFFVLAAGGAVLVTTLGWIVARLLRGSQP